jgi:hypothetical protein
MMTWLATEGGRKCPICGRYARAEQLGYTGGYFKIGGNNCHISSYGHLPGFGCTLKRRQPRPRTNMTPDPSPESTPESPTHDGAGVASAAPCSLWIVAIWCPVSAPPAIYTHESEESAKRQAEIEDQKFGPTKMSYRVEWGPVTFSTNR